jgi:putative ABC transport system ATP-binding protein
MMITCEDVTKVFNRGKPNEVRAVQGVSFEIKAGECAVFKGPSGSGKTTLLSMIGCISRPTSGRIVVDSKDVSKLPEKFLTLFRREHIGIIFQLFNLIPELSVVENVIVPLVPLGVPPREMRSRAETLMKRLGLEGKENFRVKELSGGEQQRVAIARALINNPDIVLADEPTAHLDTTLSKGFLEVMQGLKKEGKTLVIATHDPLVYDASFVDVVFKMRDGRIVR